MPPVLPGTDGSDDSVRVAVRAWYAARGQDWFLRWRQLCPLMCRIASSVVHRALAM